MVKRGKEWSRDVRGGHRRCEGWSQEVRSGQER